MNIDNNKITHPRQLRRADLADLYQWYDFQGMWSDENVKAFGHGYKPVTKKYLIEVITEDAKTDGRPLEEYFTELHQQWVDYKENLDETNARLDKEHACDREEALRSGMFEDEEIDTIVAFFSWSDEDSCCYYHKDNKGMYLCVCMNDSIYTRSHERVINFINWMNSDGE